MNDNTDPIPLTAFVYCDRDAPKTKEKTATVAPQAPAIVSATASCGGAGKAQAGGFHYVLTPPFAASMVDSFRTSNKTWRSRMISGTPPSSLTSYIYCAGGPAPKARAASVISVASQLVVAQSGQCKRGTGVLAGGFSAPDSPGMSFYENPLQSFRVGKRWQVQVPHEGTSANTLTSIAYCG